MVLREPSYVDIHGLGFSDEFNAIDQIGYLFDHLRRADVLKC